MRALAIWITGLVAFGLFGSMIGWGLAHNHYGEGAGAVAGVCLFACLRLWFPNARSDVSSDHRS